MITIEQCREPKVWDGNVLDSGGHPLQLWGWGEVKAAGNWRVERVFLKEDTNTVGQAQVLLRVLPWPLKSLAYIARGPVVEQQKREEALHALAEYIQKQHGSVALVIEPDWGEMPDVAGWVQSPNPILMARTLVLDLLRSEDELLAQMTKKTRQYIRKSQKTGLEIRQAKNLEDVKACLDIYRQTAQRAGFALHNNSYYEDIFTLLGDHSQIFMATHQGRVVAFLWLAVSEETAFELYGGVSDEGQHLRANYTLKWGAICRMKEWGVRRYDMNGLLNDGVSKFKQGFASHETVLVGSFEKPLSPWYGLWAKGLPAAKKIVRRLKN